MLAGGVGEVGVLHQTGGDVAGGQSDRRARQRRTEVAGAGDRQAIGRGVAVGATRRNEQIDVRRVAGIGATVGEGGGDGEGLANQGRTGGRGQRDRWARREQVVPALTSGCRECQRRLDVTDPGFERPVAAQTRGAGVVGRSGDVGAGGVGQSLKEAHAVRGAGDVAAVQQDVAVGAQRRTDATELRGVAGQRAGVQRVTAEQEPAIRGPVRDHLYGCVVALTVQRRGDLTERIGVVGEHQHLRAGRGALHQHLPLGDLRIDDQQRSSGRGGGAIVCAACCRVGGRLGAGRLIGAGRQQVASGRRSVAWLSGDVLVRGRGRCVLR